MPPTSPLSFVCLLLHGLSCMLEILVLGGEGTVDATARGLVPGAVVCVQIVTWSLIMLRCLGFSSVSDAL